jgi:hypothetical protein
LRLLPLFHLEEMGNKGEEGKIAAAAAGLE